MKLLRVIIVLFSVITGNSSKSIFVQPTFRPNCPHGFVLDRSGMCVEIIEIDRDDYEVFLIAKISSVDYEDYSEPEPPQSDQPSDSDNPGLNNLNGVSPDAPPTIVQDESIGKSTNSIDKRSTSPLTDLTMEENSSERITTEDSEFTSIANRDILENVTQQIGVTENDEIENFNASNASSKDSPALNETGGVDTMQKQLLENTFPSVIINNSENLKGKHHSHSHTSPKFSMNLLLQNRILKKSMNIATEVSLKHKRKGDTKNAGILIPSKKIFITFMNSDSKIHSKTGNRSQITENSTEDLEIPTKLRHSQKRKHQNLFGVLKKVFGGRKHKSKS